MYLIAIAWLYVALMMALAEASSPQGSLFGALLTFLLYGVAPMALVLYLVGTPARRKARRLAEAQEQAQSLSEPTPDSGQGDGRHHAPAEPLPPVGKEP
ncbi:hypothetical protein ACS5PK_05360 [Roseateles sp. DB2]|uniref:hypothetical protein n=1 Tax=Roseateles sp. DB2 TaxID=3453717 RepID=UPI003EEB393C